MTRLVTRVASFGRRRRPTSKDIDSSARTPSPCTSGGTSSFDEDSLNRSEVVYNTDELYGPLMKKHLRGSTFNEWGKRWASVDDAIGVLFMYKSGKEWERRAPSRVLPLNELCDVKAGAGASFELSFRRKAVQPGTSLRAMDDDADDDDDGRSLETTGSETLTLACDSVEERSAWVRGLQLRMRAQHEGTAGCDVELRRLIIDKANKKIGITLHNWAGHPVGVEVEALLAGGLAEQAGLRVGDVLVAVDGFAVFSHPHACKVLDSRQQGNTFEALVGIPKLAELS